MACSSTSNADANNTFIRSAVFVSSSAAELRGCLFGRSWRSGPHLYTVGYGYNNNNVVISSGLLCDLRRDGRRTLSQMCAKQVVFVAEETVVQTVDRRGSKLTPETG